MKRDRSQQLWKEANRVLVGGVNSPVRAFKGVGGDPFFAESGEGAYLVDVDGNRYIDYVLSWGPLILGHADPRVGEAVKKALERGASFGVSTEAEIRLAERLTKFVPSMKKVRFVNSGTEATMSAIRLARGVTKRDLIIKIEGCYHGHADGLLVKAGSGLTTLGVPTSPGVPEAYASCTLTLPYNDLEAVEAAYQAHADAIACIIIEPVPGNMGMLLPEPGYLEGLRSITQKQGSLLIFDEVMSGFRAALGGAQARYGVTPDLTTLGKVVGGGLPVGAYGGPASIMDHLSPVGPVYQAGTLSGNPLAMAAGIATLDIIAEPGVFEKLETNMTRLVKGIEDVAKEAGVPVTTAQAGAMAGFFFHEGPVRNYAEATAADTKRYGKFFWAMLESGVYFAPSQFEAFFISTAHDVREIEHTLEAARAAMKAL